MIFKIRWERLGGHIHCALFVAQARNFTYAKCGGFVVSEGLEFEQLERVMAGVEFEERKQGDVPRD